MMKGKLLLILIIASVVTGSHGLASDVVLTVIGPGSSSEKTYSEDEIRAMPSVVFTTFDPWDKKERSYKGCRLMTILEQNGFADKFQSVEVIAKNDYKATITKAEISKFSYVLSYEMDGKDYSQLGDENKGPLAIAVEIEKVGKPDKTTVKNQLVWYVKKIIVR